MHSAAADWGSCLGQVCSRGLQPAFRPALVQHFSAPERGLKPATTYLIRKVAKSGEKFGLKPSQLTQGQLLHAPVREFAHVKFVFTTAIHFVDGAELLQQLSRLAEFAEDFSVQRHLVDFAIFHPR